MDKVTKLTKSEAYHLQYLEGNPLTPDEKRFLESLDEQNLDQEECVARILDYVNREETFAVE